MTVSVLQSVSFDSLPGPTAATTTSKALPGNTTAGSSLLVFFTYSASATSIVIVTDDRNVGPWTTYAQQVNSGAQTVIGYAYRDNVVGGSIPTVTVSTGITAVPYRGMRIYEVGGTTGFGGGSSNYQASPGLGTNAVTSGPTSALASQPALLVGASMNTLDLFPPDAGSGYANDGLAFQWEFSVPFCRFETQYLTSTAGAAALFTATHGADAHATFVATFLESGGGGGGPGSRGGRMSPNVRAGAGFRLAC